MRISDWSSDVCSSDLRRNDRVQCRRPRQGRQAPVDRILPVRLQEIIRLAEMPAPEKAVMGGQRRRMRRLQHQMARSEEHTSELQSLMRISYAVFCLKKKTNMKQTTTPTSPTDSTRQTTR